MRDFTAKTALVTGGAGGIGFAMVEAFLDQGMNVVIADIEAPARDRALSDLARHAPRLRAVSCDVSSRASVAAARDFAIAAFGPVHILCNNAGVGTGGRIDTVAPPAWDWLMGVNLMGVIHGLSEFVPHMKSHGQDAHIVNTGSMAGMNGFRGMGPYCASKAAVVSLSEALASELEETPIGVSVLCPGSVNTAFYDSRRNAPPSVPPPPPQQPRGPRPRPGHPHPHRPRHPAPRGRRPRPPGHPRPRPLHLHPPGDAPHDRRPPCPPLGRLRQGGSIPPRLIPRFAPGRAAARLGQNRAHAARHRKRP